MLIVDMGLFMRKVFLMVYVSNILIDSFNSRMRKCAFLLLVCGLMFSKNVLSEQTFGGKIRKIEVVNYNSGAAYVYFDGVSFNECNIPTNWCAIDFSLPAAKEMYSAVLAAKMAQKNIRLTSNGCWSTNYARCWKVHVD